METRHTPATTVTEAFNEVNPELALGPGDPRHVDFTRWRGEDPIAPRVGTRIERASAAAEPRYIKQLVAGHRGSGKTTELLRLKDRLEKKNFVALYFDSEDDLYMENVDFADVLIATISQVVRQAEERDLDVPDPRLAQLRAKVEPIVEDVVTETSSFVSAEAGAEAKVGLFGVGGLFAKIRAATKNDETKREAIRAEVQRSPTLFLEELNDIIDNLQVQIRGRGKAGLVVIVDSLDRIVPNPMPDGRTTHSQIFVTHADQLKAPRCHMVFTVPISLTVDQNLGSHYPLEPVLQPMIRVREKDGSECAGAVDAMVEAVRRRVDVAALFEEPSGVRDLCLFSGGHIRDLMHLLTRAADYSNERFTPGSVDRAIRALTRDYDRLVRDADLGRLVQVHRDKRLPTDRDFALLPYHLIVLAYQNGEDWADVTRLCRRRGSSRRHGRGGTRVSQMMSELVPTEDAVELDALERLIRRADGFALAFARVNSLPRRRELAADLRQRLDGAVRVVEVDVPPETTDLQAVLARVYAEIEGDGKVALFVYGIERVLSSVRERTGFLPVLNYKRENLQRSVPTPVVLWVPEFALRLIARGAPDTWAWRSGVFEFATPPGETDRTWGELQEAGTVSEYARMTPAERRARIETLEALHRDYAERREEGETGRATVLADLADRLGRLYGGVTDLDTALSWSQRALGYGKRTLGPDHPSTLTAANNLGELLRVRGDLDGAERLLRRALEDRERLLGPDHPGTLATASNLGTTLRAQGDLDGAERLLRRVLEDRRRLLGPGHPRALAAANNLGTTLRARGDLDGAERLLRRALSGAERGLGPNHPDTRLYRQNLDALLVQRHPAPE